MWTPQGDLFIGGAYTGQYARRYRDASGRPLSDPAGHYIYLNGSETLPHSIGDYTRDVLIRASHAVSDRIIPCQLVLHTAIVDLALAATSTD